MTLNWSWLGMAWRGMDLFHNALRMYEVKELEEIRDVLAEIKELQDEIQIPMDLSKLEEIHDTLVKIKELDS